MPHKSTAIISHGTIDAQPTEIYGPGPIVLRIGNGGAGSTGLIKALATDYLSHQPRPASISWTCNHSRNTQLALLHNYIDIALTYERDQEALSISEGWAVSHGCVFHDHFCLAGPISDPAGVRGCRDVGEGLGVIANAGRRGEGGVEFHSRGDGSATMFKERGLWTNAAGVRPFEDVSVGGGERWYKMTQLSPAQAVIEADAAGAYLLTDRSTLLRQVADGKVHNTTVFFEPTWEGDVLMNSCFAFTSPNPSEEAVRFLEYLKGGRGQGVVAGFGVEEVGVPFFAGVGEGFARGALRGGRAVGGRWLGGGGRGSNL